jgi:AraC family transcriptional regulator of adaptative response / DNA-3-methyladenine glycosylase II
MSATAAISAARATTNDDGGSAAVLDRDTCYRALVSRDARFDGRFFVGVRTTGVYCRPICPARTPKPENITFYPCAAAAEEAGFRACLRCRPEVSPGTPAWLGTSATVSRALRLIAEGAVSEEGIGKLAERLGIGERQLRRLFDRHLGASPMAVLRTERLHLALRLIRQTGMPMTRVAENAGFASVRRFNAAIKEASGRSPTELRHGRRAARLARDGSSLVLRLAYRPPFDWGLMVDYLRARAIPGVERVDGESYRRAVRHDGGASSITVRPSEGERLLLVEVPAELANGAASAIRNVRRLFDVGAVPGEIAAHLRRDPLLRRSVERHPGMRVPGAWDGFELAIRAILGQQVTVRGATTLTGRLVEKFGEPLAGDIPAGLTHLFPSPETLSDADIASIGVPRARADTIRALARAVCDGLRLEPGADLESVVGGLKEVAGIGDWTAHYVAMRALGEPDAFPEDDLGLRRALAGGGAPVSRLELRRRAEAWRPWRAYAAMHLWIGGPWNAGRKLAAERRSPT